VKTSVLLPLLLAAPLLGCPRAVPPTVAGSDDDLLDGYSARLEELRSRVEASELPCEDRCKVALDGCALARQTCDIASRTNDRPDVQRRCAGAQEACSHFNDGCARCKGT
jgi:hypothetical protein